CRSERWVGLGQLPRREDRTGQAVPPEACGRSDRTRGYEQRGGTIMPLENGSGDRVNVGISVVESDSSPTVRRPTSRELLGKPCQRHHCPLPFEGFDLLGKLCRGDGQFPGVMLEICDPVIKQDDRPPGIYPA